VPLPSTVMGTGGDKDINIRKVGCCYNPLQKTCCNACAAQLDSLSLVSRGLWGTLWLSITLALCQILHFVSHWLVLDLSINVSVAVNHTGQAGRYVEGSL
jgi:hypothetical protein